MNLPPANTARWSPNRKAAVVMAIRSGEISNEDACRIYGFSTDEINQWLDRSESHGAKGLKATFQR